MNKRLEKFSKLIEQRRRAKAVEPAETQNASVGAAAGKVTAPVAPELPVVEEPAQVPEEPVAEEPAPVEEPVAEEPVASETPNRSRKRRGKKSKDAEE